MFKQKLLLLFISSLVMLSLGGCEQKTLLVEPKPESPEPPPSACTPVPPESQDIPVLEEYFPAIVDSPAKVANPTGNINDKLQKRILAREVVELTDADCIDLNNDGIGEVIHLKYALEEDSYYGKATLTAASRGIDVNMISPTQKFYAAMLGDVWQGVQLLIEGDGPSADPYVEAFQYENDRLWHIGTVTNYAKDIILTPKGFSGTKRGIVLQTWYRPADYILTEFQPFYEQGLDAIPPRIVEVPRDIYSMGTSVKLLCDLPLSAARTSDTPNMVIKAGQNVVLVATDNREWVYISPAGNSNYEGGWMQLKQDSYDVCLINGEEIPASNVFQGLFLAD